MMAKSGESSMLVTLSSPLTMGGENVDHFEVRVIKIKLF